jgi:heme-degrading monooxygenase HmoA
MIGVFVRFQFDDDFNDAKLRTIAEKAQEKFSGMPGLRSKTFTINAEQRRAINFYVWESKEAAKDFYSEAMLEQVSGLYGVRPSLDFVEIAQLVDNTNT